jgi:recombination protein RecR
MRYPRLIENLIEQLVRFPGVGRRSAERMAFWLLDQTGDDVKKFAHAVVDLKEGLGFCQECNNLADQPICPICLDAQRDQGLICVVEDPKDVIAVEKTGQFAGLYHVLLGTISPNDGRGPDDIKIQHLLQRVEKGQAREIILATDPDNEGEMTALYLTRLLRPSGVKISRIGLGLPMGGAVEYADMSTLGMSLLARREITPDL